MTTLMEVKYTVPPLRSDLLQRPGLSEKMNRELQSDGRFTRKLTLISAPAGYGKTTAALQWLQALDSCTAWVSLDEGDNDGRVFWSYVVRALSEVHGGVGKKSADYLQAETTQLAGMAGGPTDYRNFLKRLVNEMASLPKPAILVLDDYHVIEERDIHDGISYLLQHLPPTVHVVLVTRVDPPVGLSRLRGRGEILEVRAADLRLDARAVRQLVCRMTGYDVRDDELAELLKSTRGWITGLQLFALSASQSDDISQLIHNLAGQNRYILEYLLDEVLAHQPPEVRDFLLQTSPLNRFTPSLCDHVTKSSRGLDMLMRLQRQNLFVVKLDEAGRWYRYHPLFGQLLRHQLAKERPREVGRILCRAADWYRQKGMVPAAVDAFIDAEAFGQAADVLQEEVEKLWYQGREKQLLRWFDALSEESIMAHRRLCIFYCTVLLVNAARSSEAEHYLTAAERFTSDNYEKEAEPGSFLRLTGAEMEGLTRALRAQLAAFSGDAEGFLAAADGIMNYFRARRSNWRPLAATLAAEASEWQGDVRKCDRLFRLALEDGRELKDPIFCLLVANRMAFMKLRDAKLTEVLQLCSDQLEFAEETGFAGTSRAGTLWSLQGEIHRERNELECAAECIQKGIDMAEEGPPTAAAWNLIWRLRLLLSCRRLQEMEDLLGYVREHMMGLAAWIDRKVIDLRVRLAICRGDHAAAERLLTPFMKMDEPIGPWYDETHLNIVRLLLAQDRVLGAVQRLESLEDYFSERGSTRGRLQATILRSVALHRLDRADAASVQLRAALQLGEAEGFVRSFLQEGEEVHALLLKCKDRGICSCYVQKLLDEFAGETDTAAPGDEGQLAPADEITAREREILRLLSEGLSNKEIADRLFISLNTVKWHASNIYSKLGAANRTEAASIAKRLGILQD